MTESPEIKTYTEECGKLHEALMDLDQAAENAREAGASIEDFEMIQASVFLKPIPTFVTRDSRLQERGDESRDKILDFFRSHPGAPLRKVGAACGIQNVNSVHYHCKVLAQNGQLIQRANRRYYARGAAS